MRWVTPILFSLVAGYVAYHNAYRVESTGSWVVFPFLRSVVGPEPEALSQATIGLLLALSGLTALSAWRRGRAVV
jgi:hypothetical protein